MSEQPRPPAVTMATCLVCGAVVMDPSAHALWHAARGEQPTQEDDG